MNGYLLDTNLLIALFWPRHDGHKAALDWFIRQRTHGWATCPITQAGFVRVVSNPAFSRDAPHPRDAIRLLAINTAAHDHAFWSDDLPIAEAVEFTGVRLLGHQQVTDAYLLGLAVRRGGVLATLDRRITALLEPKSTEWKSLEVVT